MLARRAGSGSPFRRAGERESKMKLKLSLRMDNAAFFEVSGSEVARILRKLAADYEDRDLLPGESSDLRDVNGNTVGQAKVVK